MQHDGFTVFVVEDDQSVRDSLALLLGLQGFPAAMYADAEDFLSAFKPEWYGCLLVDLRLPGMSGLELQRRLRDMRCGLPVVVMTEHGDVESARQAFRAGAIDFLEKPLDQSRLLAAIADAHQRQAADREHARLQGQTLKKLAALTPREREVMGFVVAGVHNRHIAAKLGISVRTIEVHKSRMMDKLGVDGIPQLVRLTIALGQEGERKASV